MEDKSIQRFIDAQKDSYEEALNEIKGGRKRGHWIWYIFPQIEGLGFSYISEFYAIKGMEEAKKYLENEILKSRLIEISEALLQNDCDIYDIVGSPDNLKICSCMTLFHEADPEIEVFKKVIDKFYGGNYDKKTLSIIKIGRKPTNREMVEVFRDTMNLIKSEESLIESVENTIKNTKLYAPDSEMILPENPQYKAKITVTTNRSFKAAKELSEKYPSERIAVLNFASQISPGGGATTGARAQEESLCRCSTLYPCLNQKFLLDNYYAPKNSRDFRYTDNCIYTPDIVVIKSDINIPERLDKNKWYKVDVITCAAPNLRRNPYALSPDEQYEIHCKRARRILSSAALNGATVLVLGAFGCGAFRNIPEKVAMAYKDILDEFSGYFKAVEFAVFVANEEDRNYTAFRDTFL